MNEVLADVSALTGQEKYLSLSTRFCHRALLDPLTQKRDTLDGLHSNTQIPKVIGFSRLYDLTGQQNYGTAAKFFWSTVVDKRSFVTGGNGDGEHFFPPADFARHLGSAKTMETCCTHNMGGITPEIQAQHQSRDAKQCVPAAHIDKPSQAFAFSLPIPWSKAQATATRLPDNGQRLVPTFRRSCSVAGRPPSRISESHGHRHIY